jgi:hypothetical protein
MQLSELVKSDVSGYELDIAYYVSEHDNRVGRAGAACTGCNLDPWNGYLDLS